jgi:ubiquitin-activating enzyme E1
VTLYDPNPMAIEDLGTQFFLRPEDAGKGLSRAEATAPRLAELNSYVPVRVLEEAELSKDVLARFQVSIAWQQSAEPLLTVCTGCGRDKRAAAAPA